MESLGSATEIVDQADRDSVSLVKEYKTSVDASPSSVAGSLQTMIGNEPTGPRVAPDFSNESIPPSSDVRIQVIHKEHTAKTLLLPSGTVTIGRGKNNHIVLDDEQASRNHAQITWDGLEYHVMDLDSRNGTYLENIKLLAGVSAVWRRDQVLRIGDTWLKLIQPATKATSGTGSMLDGSASVARSTAGSLDVSVTPQQLSVEPGGSVTATVLLINQSPNVDHFALSLMGIPNAWVASLPPRVYLMPKTQTETAFTLQVPRAPESQAGQHEMTLKVTSERDPSQSVDVQLVLTVEAYSQFESELQPQRLRTGQFGSLTISNQGNHLEKFTIRFQDAANELTFQPPQKEIEGPAGKSAEKKFQAQLRETRWIGGGKIHPFSASISLQKGERQTLHGEMLSRGLVPAWVPPLALFICLALIGGAGLFYRQTSDLDGDGLTFSEEINSGCNPNNTDSDNDGLLDGEERGWGTDCNVRDTDGDTLDDGVEVHEKKTHPNNRDTDGDNSPDNIDSAPLVFPTLTASPLPTSTIQPTTISPTQANPPTTIPPTPAPPTDTIPPTTAPPPLPVKNIVDAIQLPGPKVAANEVDKWVLAMDHRILVITNDGAVFAHTVTANSVTDAIQLPGPNGLKVAANLGDKWVLAMDNRILVITNDGSVFAHRVTANSVTDAPQLPGPKVAANAVDRWVLAMDNRILVITDDGSVFAHTVTVNSVTDAPQLLGPKVAANGMARRVLAMGNRILVITDDGSVFAHTVTANRITDAIQLTGPRVAANPVDRWVLAMGNRILVITPDGSVFAHSVDN